MQKESTRQWMMVVLFLLGFLVLDRAAGFGLGLLFARIDSGESSGGLANAALKHKDAQVIVFGNSRSRHHVNPRVMEAILGGKVHNAGSQGQGIHYQRILEELLLDAGTQADVFVRIFDVRDLESDAISGANSLSPFYGRNARVDALLESAGNFAELKYQLHTYRYNSLILPILRNLISPEQLTDDGFKPLEGNRVETDPRKVLPTLPPSNPLKLREQNQALIAEFNAAAKAKGIRVVGVIGPRWRLPRPLSPDEVAYFDLYKKLSAAQGVPVLELDERHIPAFEDPSLYYDQDHLNAKGADVFSSLLAERLKALREG